MPALDGRAIIVTGAGRGLGRAYAVAIAAAGGRVLVCDAQAQGVAETVESIREAGGTAHPYVARLSDQTSARMLVAECIERFGALDGLVANAGVLNPGPAREQDQNTVDQTLQTNIAAVWHCCVSAMDVMVQAGQGSIVTVVSGAMQGLPGLALYGMSKSAVLGLTYGLALELEQTGVRINAMSPLAHTPMSDLMDIDDAAKGAPADGVAPLVVYLLGDQSRHLNGQVLRFDGVRLGVVSGPRLTHTTTERAEWTADDVAVAVAGPLRAGVVPVGLVASAAPVVVEASWSG